MQKPSLILTNVVLFTVTTLICLFLVPVEGITNGFDRVEIISCITLIWLSGLSITAGYHRLWAHKAYDAHPVIRVLFALGGALALQNSILHWASDHRVHHKHVDDNDRDPYSAGRGFWFSHIGWMLREYQASRYQDYNNCRDLQKDRVVMWQHKHYLVLTLTTNFGLPLLLGWLNGDIWGMLLLAGVLRLAVVHHVTFFINSLAHMWGKQPYTDRNSARDSGFLALLTFGEGYHNYHHSFEYDYRNGIRWWQFDPTKWLIRGLSYLGLTKNLRRVPEQRIERARVEMQLKHVQRRVAHLPNANVISQRVQKEYELLVEKMTAYYDIKKRLLEIKKRQVAAQYEKLDLDYKYRELKQAFALAKSRWLEMHKFETDYS
ncbi:fatty acid desaturase [Lacimicrobium alkaliphilum]|uniref:Acyl-CoA desaturase n=1 Tax=Lacimicrobium alkaliphilum TaxID=1526571 RepID=A0ABQ1RMA8_9ALTE|nr:fatty acid desaturase [Lacimicrobium alkaliphilum]GGD73019.1 acyl-CoA desaturase [Lacimicrobium alkaliphilum]